MSNILNMLLRYAFCIILIIILMILGLMFFYFNNQIVYQNNKLNAMIDVVKDLAQIDVNSMPISCPYIPGQSYSSKSISQPSQIPLQMNIIDVSDSEDDDSDDDDDDEDDDAGKCCNDKDVVCDKEGEDIVNELDRVLEIIENCESGEKSHDAVLEECIQVEEFETLSSSKDNSVTIEVILDTSSAEPKHGLSNPKSLHLNELRELVVQCNMLSMNEAKKMKKSELVDLISKKTEHVESSVSSSEHKEE